MTRPRLSIFARWPEAGSVKTRLIPALGPEGAARVYRRLLDLTLAAAADSGLDFEVRITGCDPARFAVEFALPCPVIDQGDGDLSARLLRVTAPAIVIGSDAPRLTAAILQRAADAVLEHGAVIGPASDGGYYLLGFRESAPFAFTDMSWSHEYVARNTIARFAERGIEPRVLETLDDIDTPEDLARYPELLA